MSAVLAPSPRQLCAQLILTARLLLLAQAIHLVHIPLFLGLLAQALPCLLSSFSQGDVEEKQTSAINSLHRNQEEMANMHYEQVLGCGWRA